jgi:hypothetical protein
VGSVGLASIRGKGGVGGLEKRSGRGLDARDGRCMEVEGESLVLG